MDIELGTIRSLFRHPVKSMAAERLDSVAVGSRGVAGDRRLAFRRLVEDGGYPWLTASKLPEMLLYRPRGSQEDTQPPGCQVLSEPLPSHVLTPTGDRLEIAGEALAAELSRRYGSAVELRHVSDGIFDEASVSLIALGTLRGIERAWGRELDVRRFRPNIVLDTSDERPFAEDAWVGKQLEFGDGDGPIIRITLRDKRCVMINLDPDTAESAPDLMKTVVRLNDNYAGVYGEVVRQGELRVGQGARLRD
jgi:uncharacterized protein YcbX